MKTRILLGALCLTLMGQSDCEQSDPEPLPEGTAYCAGNNYSVLDAMEFGWDRDGVAGAFNAILAGEPSTNRRSTVYVRFGSSYCTGAVLGPRLVLTAAHCGYAATTAHQVYVPIPTGEDKVNMSGPFAVAEHIVHPDYWDWVRNSDLEARKSDLMLLHMEDDLPGPYLGMEAYTSNFAKACRGLAAQGFGRWEGSGLSLREGKYLISTETEKYLHSMGMPDAKICFGDSGGPLYADVAGVPILAGITTTTASKDCLRGGTHVKVAAYLDWIANNAPGQ